MLLSCVEHPDAGGSVHPRHTRPVQPWAHAQHPRPPRRGPSHAPPRSSRQVSSRTSRGPSAGRRANWAITTSFIASSGSSPRGCRGSACPCRKTPPGNRPFTTPPSTQSLPHGPMRGRSGRHASPVCGSWRTSSPLIAACGMATGPTPWPKQGGGDRVCGVHTPAGRAGHRDHGPPWVGLRSRPRGSRP